MTANANDARFDAIFDVIVVGGGPAGLAAACAAWEAGAERVLLAERDRELGGILNQCIHTGFGLHHFKEELTGPEYAQRFVDMLRDTNVQVALDTMALRVTADRRVHLLSPSEGYRVLDAKAVVLAMGCRERTRGAIGIPGDRPAGVLTAGSAQKYINMEGYTVGERAVILGSGDIGLIMARRLTLEGAKVLACVELMPQPGGLTRNVVQCLHDFDIPLLLSHTVVRVRGDRRVEGVTIARVDGRLRPVPGTERDIACDTLLLSVGLIPENELTQEAGVPMDGRTRGACVYENNETEIPGIFSAGNVLHVHDLVDFVTAEGLRAGRAAARFARELDAAESNRPASVLPSLEVVEVVAGEGVAYAVPQRVRPANVDKALEILFRVGNVFSKSRVEVAYGEPEAVVHAYKRDHMIPAEMERIRVPKATLEKALQAGGRLIVRAKEAGEDG
ncbi:MAG: NAD(P)/FAD-dependent oxidoreductase [Clostridia bacterium]|nr:NAD(P)/FAD-dependent oxidoreductase [Clostridia bacterium]